MKSPAYVLAITSSGGLLPAVSFNGWLAYRKRAPEWDGNTCATRKLNAWLLPGKNLLRVLVPPAVAPPGPGCERDMLRVWLYKAEHGRDPEKDPEITLLDYRWVPELAPVANDGATELLRHELIVAKAYGRWRWEEARAYLDGDRPAVEALVVELHAALVARDVDRFMDRMQIKLEELARATQRDPAEVAGEQRAFIGGLMRFPEWRVEPLDLSALELEASADGRLVAVTDEHGKNPLKVWLDDSSLGFDLTVSLLREGCAVVR